MTGMLLISAAMAAAGMQPTTATTPQASPARPGDSRVVCRRDDMVGTRLAPRVCRTRAEWRRLDAEERMAARELIDGRSAAGGLTPPTPAGGN